MQEYGLQLYSVRDAMKKDLPGTIKKVAELGYAGVEFAGFFDYSAKDIKKILDDNGLKVFGTHTGLGELTDDKIGATIEYMKEIGNKNIVIPGAPIGNKAQQDATLARINIVQPILEKEGLTLSFHNHSHEFAKKWFTPVFYPRLTGETSCGLEVDTFWAFNAGIDPVAHIEKYAARIHLIHLKDGFKKKRFKPAQGMSLGSGEAPVEAVVNKAIELGFGIVVESETQKPDGISEVKRCIDYLKSLNK